MRATWQLARLHGSIRTYIYERLQNNTTAISCGDNAASDHLLNAWTTYCIGTKKGRGGVVDVYVLYGVLALVVYCDTGIAGGNSEMGMGMGMGTELVGG
jgi:hypothetical protein